MKVLTLTQPWATLVAIGVKHIETRSWVTNYRGPLAIHAAKGLAGEKESNLWDRCLSDPFRVPLLNAGYGNPGRLPRGAIVAVCELKTIARIDYYKPDPDAILDWEGPFLTFGVSGELLPDEPELSFGDYTPGRYAWLLADIRALPEPIPARGALGLWEYEGDIER